MNHKISLHGVILMSGILSFAVFIHKTNGILTDSNKLDCTDIQCPVNCPADSFLQAADNNFAEDDEDEDYVEELMTPEPYIEEIGHFEELPPEVEVHETNTQHSIRERQKREVFFQDDIDRCCGDQICVCHKSCPDVPKCSPEEVAIEVKEGRGLPGNCCSKYKCVKKVTCSAGVKQSWWKNKCIKCLCFGNNEICEQLCAEEEVIQNCFSEYWQKPMMNGVSWKEGGCTSCTCEQGERSCLTPVCPKLECERTITLEDECCAKCVKDEKKEEFVNNENWPKVPNLEMPTENDHLDNKTTLLVTTKKESAFTISQLESTTEVNRVTELEGIVAISTTQSTLVTVDNTTTNSVSEMEYSSSVSSIESSTEAKNSTSIDFEINSVIEPKTTTEKTLIPKTEVFVDNENETEVKNSTSTDFEINSVIEPKTTTETTLIPEAEILIHNENETLSPIQDIFTSPEVTEKSVKSSTSFSISQSSNSSVLAETTTPTIYSSSTDTSNTTDATIATSTEEPLSNVMKEESSPVKINNPQLISSSTMPTLPGEEMTTVANLLNSTAENLYANNSKEIDTEETTTNLPSQELADTSSSTTSTTEDSSTSIKLPELTDTSSSTTSTPKDSSTSIKLPETTTHIPFTTSDSSTTSTTADSTTSTKLPETTTSATSPIILAVAIDSTTPAKISSTKVPKAINISSQNNSTDFTTTTSTTSSPFSSTTYSTTNTAPSTQEGTTSSTTSSPDTVEPFFQSFGDSATVDTQQQMRGMFDKIDYVVMIVLFIGALLCIALGLIIRHTKNRKKMYSSIPNSETSLSQTSTNTMMTV